MWDGRLKSRAWRCAVNTGYPNYTAFVAPAGAGSTTCVVPGFPFGSASVRGRFCKRTSAGRKSFPLKVKPVAMVSEINEPGDAFVSGSASW